MSFLPTQHINASLFCGTKCSPPRDQFPIFSLCIIRRTFTPSPFYFIVYIFPTGKIDLCLIFLSSTRLSIAKRLNHGAVISEIPCCHSRSFRNQNNTHRDTAFIPSRYSNIILSRLHKIYISF